jgi:hypothetical protein
MLETRLNRLYIASVENITEPLLYEEASKEHAAPTTKKNTEMCQAINL